MYIRLYSDLFDAYLLFYFILFLKDKNLLIFSKWPSCEAKKNKASSFVYYTTDSSSFQKNCGHSAEKSTLLKFNDSHTTGAEHFNCDTLFCYSLLFLYYSLLLVSLFLSFPLSAFQSLSQSFSVPHSPTHTTAHWFCSETVEVEKNISHFWFLQQCYTFGTRF